LAQTIEAAHRAVHESQADPAKSERPSTRALAAFDLRKSYGRRRVVDNVSLHVEPGEVVVVRFAGTGTEMKLMADYAPLKKK